MIELVFVTCLAATPTDCRERSLLYTDITSQVCMLGAQVELARWVETHPNWNVGRWSCRAVVDEHDI